MGQLLFPVGLGSPFWASRAAPRGHALRASSVFLSVGVVYRGVLATLATDALRTPLRSGALGRALFEALRGDRDEAGELGPVRAGGSPAKPLVEFTCGTRFAASGRGLVLGPPLAAPSSAETARKGSVNKRNVEIFFDDRSHMSAAPPRGSCLSVSTRGSPSNRTTRSIHHSICAMPPESGSMAQYFH